MNREEITKLILDWYLGEITEEQQKTLDQWISENPKNQELFKYITDSERIKDKQMVLNLFNEEKAWEHVYNKIRRKKKLYLRLIRYAALCLLLLSVSLYWYSRPTETPQTPKIVLQSPQNIEALLSINDTLEEKILTSKQYAIKTDIHAKKVTIDTMTLTIPRGGEFQLTLEDGTIVWLNSETQIRFPSRFDARKREVFLMYGEAYFQVAKNEKCPFVVHSENTSVEVLGTEFNLQNYPNEPNIMTTLVTGSVRFSSSDQKLVPGEQTIFNKSTQTTSIRKIDTNVYTAWKNGRFIFKSTPLENILNQMSRWYNIQFEYEDETLKTLPFSGNVEKYKDGNIILELLKSTEQIDFIQQGDIILVKR